MGEIQAKRAYERPLFCFLHPRENVTIMRNKMISLVVIPKL